MKRTAGLLVFLFLVLGILYASMDRMMVYLLSRQKPGPGPSPGEVYIHFDEYRGTAETLPDGMFLTGADGTGKNSAEGYNPFSGVVTVNDHEAVSSCAGTDAKKTGGVTDSEALMNEGFSGFFAVTAAGEEAAGTQFRKNGKPRKNGEYSFGIRERGETDLRDARLFYRYTNKTEKVITGFTVSYEVETWFVGERDNSIRLKYNTARDGFSNIEPIVTTYNPGFPQPDRSVEQRKNTGTLGYRDGRKKDNRTVVEVSFSLESLKGPGAEFDSLQPGEKAYFRWQYSNGRVAEGRSRSGLGLSHIKIIPLFEQSSEPLAWGMKPGFYQYRETPFLLSLETSLAGADIFYTLDGSDPDPQSVMSDREYDHLPRETRQRTFLYRGPIDLNAVSRRNIDIALIPTNREEGIREWVPPAEELPKGVVVKAKAVGGDTNCNETAVQTKSFFLFPEGRERYTFPVVSLSTGRANLFCPASGIYVEGADPDAPNYHQRGREWERPAYVELFDTENRRPLAQTAGIRIHGSFTRTFPQKTLRLYSRSDYGVSRLNYPFFDTKELDDYNRILLRNSGNDWGFAMLSDAATQTLTAHLGFDTQHYQPAVLFINGEYWGIHNFRDRYDQHYLETHYEVPRDKVIILEDNHEIDVGNPEDADHYLSFLDNLKAGRFTTWDEVNRYIVLSGFIDYITVQLYAGNTDWPHNNTRWWRYTGAEKVHDNDGLPPAQQNDKDPFDGRWRWLMFDLDYSFGYSIHAETASPDMVQFTFGDFSPTFPWARVLLHELIQIEEIRHELIQRTGTYLASLFKPEHVTGHLDILTRRLRPEIADHAARWGRPLSVNNWEFWTSRMYDFAEKRAEQVREHIIDFFPEATGTAELSIAGIIEHDEHGEGTISLHTMLLCESTPGVTMEKGVWKGELFTGVPVVLESAKTDLSGFEVQGAAEDISIEKNKIGFILLGNASIGPPGYFQEDIED